MVCKDVAIFLFYPNIRIKDGCGQFVHSKDGDIIRSNVGLAPTVRFGESENSERFCVQVSAQSMSGLAVAMRRKRGSLYISLPSFSSRETAK